MVRTSIEKLANDIGFDIGNSDDIVQSDLLNGFCRALSNSMQKDKRNMQICYIVDKLENESFEIILEIAEFINLKKQEK